MDLVKLLEYLGLEEPLEFQYFENISELMEMKEDVSPEALYSLVKEIPKESLAELVDSYFLDIQEACPDTEADIYTLLELLKKVLTSLLLNAETDTEIAYFADELLRFKEWYVQDSLVTVTHKKKGESKEMTVLEALTVSRLEKLGEDEFDYDFTQTTDYSLDDNMLTYVVTDTYDDDDEDGYDEEATYDDGDFDYYNEDD